MQLLKIRCGRWCSRMLTVQHLTGDMDNSRKQTVNISELFAKLVRKTPGKKTANGADATEMYQLDGMISSFLYYMFPRDLFIRAMSLLESNDMFIYILDEPATSQSASSPTLATSMPTITDSDATTIHASISDGGAHNNEIVKDEDVSQRFLDCSKSLIGRYIHQFYPHDSYSTLHEIDFLYRLIVKQRNINDPPIYTDLINWFCSCGEYSRELSHEMKQDANKNKSLMDYLLLEIDDMDEFSNDNFAKLEPFSLSRQRYFKYERVLCPHLLAYSILLASNVQTLNYFANIKSNVIILPVSNIDEWLKLHINIII